MTLDLHISEDLSWIGNTKYTIKNLAAPPLSDNAEEEQTPSTSAEEFLSLNNSMH